MDQCLSENMNNNTSREIEMVTPRKSPERRQSLIGSSPDGRPSTRTSQLPRFYGHVLGNGDAPPSSVWVCASKGWLREHEIWPLAAITHKKEVKKFHTMDARGSRYLWLGLWAHHESTWQCPAREHSRWKQEPSLPDGASPPWPSEGLQTTRRQLLLVWPMSWGPPLYFR